jgi:exodeoxyribonuclease V gamma subunit
VHACHGRQREVEVLRDALLARFAADDTLQPEDVLVLAPDINDYAALVEGVFGTELDVSKRPGTRARIPLCFADRAPLAEAPGLAAFRGVLSLAFSRRPLSHVAALLDSAPVQDMFGLSEDDAEQLGEWLELAKVRWGEDAPFRARFHNPTLPAHTWRWGLDRLLLGYAIEGDGERLYDGILPVEGVEGSGAQPLGALCAFCEVLFSHLEVLEQPRAVSEWPGVLLDAYDALVSSGSPWTRSRAQLVSALRELNGDHTVGLAAVLSWLDTRLEVLDRHERFFAGGVTFASLRPGRAIPARVVCLLGLDHDRYPRDPARLAFDLLAADPQPGDLGSRDEDRLSFEAAVHAAGDHLHLSFVGRGSRDNKERPPSVMVADLLDLVGPEQAGAVKVAHPMQPFSPRIFRDPDWPAYSKAWRAGALALEGGGGTPALFFPEPLPEADEAEVIPLSLLLRFFQNPAKALLSVRLDLRFPGEETGVPDREPFALNFLEQWQVGQPLVEALLGGTDPQTLCPVMSASGLLPMGTPGRLVFSEILDKARKVADEALTCGAGEAVGDVDVDLDIGGRRLLGRLDGRHEKGALHVAYGSKSPKRFLSGWIKHLVAHEAGVNPLQLWVVGRGSQNKSGVESWGPVPEAGACLGVLLDLYGQGMLEPLPFMPKTSHAYASAYAAARFDKGLEEQEARDVGQSKAADAWFSTQLRGGDSIPGEGEDPAVARTFEASVIKSEEFHRTALCVFLPLLGHSLPEDLLS